MSDLSPPKPEEKETEGGRAVALGAMRRVFKARQRARGDNRTALLRIRREDEEFESDDEDTQLAPIAQNTSNHYTLNMPSPPSPQSDLPYILLGCVSYINSLPIELFNISASYLQFFFNLSLILVFLYLVLQFILTVQRDVEQRISEYSMGTFLANDTLNACSVIKLLFPRRADIVQEIAMCASQYKNNLCASNPIPAMIHQCASWETCMNRDPTIVGRAKVGAELIAEVVNGFVEPISWKTLVSHNNYFQTKSHELTLQGVHLDLIVVFDCLHQHATFALPVPASSCSDGSYPADVSPTAGNTLSSPPVWRISASCAWMESPLGRR